jgi:hypothetical protein
MTSRVLAFAGHKQAGKTTCSNFLHGYQLRANGIIDGFDITTDGKLVIKTLEADENGNEVEARGFLDVNRNDGDFAEWAAYSMWPYIKNYSFARPLKQDIAINLFNLDSKNIYGSNKLKNAETPYNWEDMPGIITDKSIINKKEIKELINKGILKYHEPGKITYREFLQYFGTDICRRIYEDIWHSRLVNDIMFEQPLVAVVDDCRFVNEVESIKKISGKVIYLTRNPYDDNHVSESELNEYDGFDLVIDNEELSIHETNVKIIEALNSWGWLGKEIVPQTPPPQQNQPQILGGIKKIKN